MVKCRVIVLLTVFLLALLVGCEGTEMIELEDEREEESAPKPTLDVEVRTSGNEATIIVTTDLEIRQDKVGMARKEGEGHIHMYVDGGEKIAVLSNTYILEDLEPGKHIVRVSLHNNDHTPYDVAKEVEFEIR